MVTEKRFKRVVERLDEEIGKLGYELWDARQEIRKQTKINTKKSIRVDVSAFGQKGIECLYERTASVAEVLPLLLDHLGLEVRVRPDKVEQAPVYLQEKEVGKD